MNNEGHNRRLTLTALAVFGLLHVAQALAADSINGQVLGAGAPISNSTVTLWAASAGAPKQLAQTSTGADRRFALNSIGAPGTDVSIYLIAKGGTPAANKAKGDNPAIALMTVLGSNLPAAAPARTITVCFSRSSITTSRAACI